MTNTDTQKELFNLVTIEFRKNCIVFGREFMKSTSFWELAKVFDRLEEFLDLVFKEKPELKEIFDSYYKQELEEFNKKQKLEEERRKRKIQQEEKFRRLQESIEDIEALVVETQRVAEEAAGAASIAAATSSIAAVASSLTAGKTIWDWFSGKEKSR